MHKALISGFSNFTAEELNLIQTLIKANATVVIDLVMERNPLNEKLSENSLFFENEKLFFKINEWARENGIQAASPRVVTKKRVNDDLRKLERYWVASTQGQLGQNRHEQNNSVEVLEFNSRYAEVEHVATAIRKMMTKDDRLNFSDFSVLTRHLSDYDTIIKPIFDQFDIPIFYDMQVAMKNHPLLELINALFDVQKRHFRYEDVMRLLKTGLLRPENDADPDGKDFVKSVQITEITCCARGFTEVSGCKKLRGNTNVLMTLIWSSKPTRNVKLTDGLTRLRIT